ncbi:hypothetical protein KP509_35G069300 [Ceratopteris richardii]|uniref:Histone RNA hairpin-binding protein RNA-binding domain-containing protein n=1 Tax=Ceratopteris richardii TaxID=49495 RepID=A0A8T2QI26_CERRI|nr:hypothetical protein KP509_35G069300 [Ceratopteris richardii]
MCMMPSRFCNGLDIRSVREGELFSAIGGTISDLKSNPMVTCSKEGGDSSDHTRRIRCLSSASGFTSHSRCYPPEMQVEDSIISRFPKSFESIAHRTEAANRCTTGDKKIMSNGVRENRSFRYDGAREVEVCYSSSSPTGGNKRGGEFQALIPEILQKASERSCEPGYENHSSVRKRSSVEYDSTKEQSKVVHSCNKEEAARLAKFDPGNENSAIQSKSSNKRRYSDTSAQKSVNEESLIRNKKIFLKECIGIRSSRENSSYASGEQINTKRQCSGLKIEPKENSLCVRRIEQGVKSERRSGNMCDLAPSIDLDTAVRMNKFVSKSPEEVCPSINSDLNAEKKSRKNDGDLPTTKSPSGIFVDVTNKFELHAGSALREKPEETDAHRLSQRQKQIEYGKNTLGYERYTELVPRFKRKAKDPQTPNPKQVCSKRSWDGQIRKWRRLLHLYDPPSEDGEEVAEDLSRFRNADTDPSYASKRGDKVGDETESVQSAISDNLQPAKDANLTIYDDWMES